MCRSLSSKLSERKRSLFNQMRMKDLKILSLLQLMMIRSKSGGKRTQMMRRQRLLKKIKRKEISLKQERLLMMQLKTIRHRGQQRVFPKNSKARESSMASPEATEEVSREEETSEVVKEAEAREAHTEVATKMAKESRDPTEEEKTDLTEEERIDLTEGERIDHTDQDPSDQNPKSTSLPRMSHGTLSRRDKS